MTQLPRDITSKVDSRSLRMDITFKDNLKRQLMAMEDSNMAPEPKHKIGFLKLFKYNFASITALIMLLVLVGGASAVVSSNRTKLANLRATEIPQDLSGVVSVESVRSTALNDVPGGTITGIELEQEDEGLLYKVKFSDGSVRFYDARSGQAVSRNTGVQTDQSVPSGFSAGISLQQARDIAQQQRPGKTIRKIELETEHGAVVYSVRFTDGGRVDVHANNGSITRNEGAGSSGGSTDDSNDSGGSGSDDNSGSGSGSGSNSGSGSSGSGSSNDDSNDDSSNSGSGSSGNSGGSNDD